MTSTYTLDGKNYASRVAYILACALAAEIAGVDYAPSEGWELYEAEALWRLGFLDLCEGKPAHYAITHYGRLGSAKTGGPVE